jgi:hypothetical protein
MKISSLPKSYVILRRKCFYEIDPRGQSHKNVFGINLLSFYVSKTILITSTFCRIAVKISSLPKSYVNLRRKCFYEIDPRGKSHKNVFGINLLSFSVSKTIVITSTFCRIAMKISSLQKV